MGASRQGTIPESRQRLAEGQTRKPIRVLEDASTDLHSGDTVAYCENEKTVDICDGYGIIKAILTGVEYGHDSLGRILRICSVMSQHLQGRVPCRLGKGLLDTGCMDGDADTLFPFQRLVASRWGRGP